MILFETGFSKVMKKYRLKAGLTQAQLAEVAFSTEKTINRLECAKHDPWWNTVLIISYVLRIPLNELFPTMPSCLKPVAERDNWPPPAVEPTFSPPVGPGFEPVQTIARAKARKKALEAEIRSKKRKAKVSTKEQEPC